jgi:hypothetical protein
MNRKNQSTAADGAQRLSCAFEIFNLPAAQAVVELLSLGRA